MNCLFRPIYIHYTCVYIQICSIRTVRKRLQLTRQRQRRHAYHSYSRLTLNTPGTVQESAAVANKPVRCSAALCVYSLRKSLDCVIQGCWSLRLPGLVVIILKNNVHGWTGEHMPPPTFWSGGDALFFVPPPFECRFLKHTKTLWLHTAINDYRKCQYD